MGDPDRHSIRTQAASVAALCAAAPSLASGPLSSLCLAALAFVIAGLMIAGAVSVLVTARLRSRFVAGATVALSLVGAAVAVGWLAVGTAPASFGIPVGLPGTGLVLTLDGLSCFFALLLFVASSAAATAALDDHGDTSATAPLLPVLVGAMALTLVAGDAFSLMLGFETMSLASFGLILTRQADPTVRDAALLYIGMAGFAAACLVPALALLTVAGPAGLDLGFAAMRAHPPTGWRAVVVFLLALFGAGSKAGLAPLHVWLPPAHAAAPGHVSALMSGAMTKIALYVLIRILFDLCGPATPTWWGLPLLVLGSSGAVLGGLRANLEADIKSVLACSTIENIGLMVLGLGLALAARAADLTPLAALAFGGVLLHALAHGTFKPLLFVAAGATQHAAGTRLLARLGGLVRGMPVTTAAVVLGGAALAGLPPSSGFAGEWTLFQAALAAPRIGGVGLQTIVCVVAMLMALAAGLAAAAAVRLIGVGYLGRPRSPRAAAAEEAGPGTLKALFGLGIATLLIGLFPGVVLRLAAAASRSLVAAGLSDRAGALAVAPQADGPGYSALAITLLLGLVTVFVVWLVRTQAIQGHCRSPAWDCGFGAPPLWLPFGDPLTQYGAASFGQPLKRALGATVLDMREMVDMPAPGETRPARIVGVTTDPAEGLVFRPVAVVRDALSAFADRMQFLTVRQTLSVMFIAVVVFLAAVALTEQL